VFDVSGVRATSLVIQPGSVGADRAGLLVALLPAHTQAAGLDPGRGAQWLLSWGFVLKFANTSTVAAGIERIEACWRGSGGFRATSHPGLTMVDRGDRVSTRNPLDAFLPLIVPPAPRVLSRSRWSSSWATTVCGAPSHEAGPTPTRSSAPSGSPVGRCV